MAGHIIVSNVPGGYKLWHQLGVLQMGHMEDSPYAYNVFMRHFERVRAAIPGSDFSGLELGPGDSVVSALIARGLGASRYYLVDAGDFARHDVAHYRRMTALLADKGISVPSLSDARSFSDVLRSCNAVYGAAGIASLGEIPTASLDFVWSHGVLQSVRRAEFLKYMLELRRILKPSGVSSHRIALNDLFVGGLNHLRIPSALWESGALSRSGTYTNRFRYSEMLALFKNAGFEPDVVGISKWDKLPIQRRKLQDPYRRMSDDELCVSGFDVVLKPSGATSVVTKSVAQEPTARFSGSQSAIV